MNYRLEKNSGICEELLIQPAKGIDIDDIMVWLNFGEVKIENDQIIKLNHEFEGGQVVATILHSKTFNLGKQWHLSEKK